MKKSMAWDLANITARARRLAEEAAHRAGVTVEEWLDEAIVGRVAGDISDQGGDPIHSHGSAQFGRAPLDETEEIPDSAIGRFGRLKRNEEHLANAFETMASMLERTRESDRGTPPSARRQTVPPDERPAAAAVRDLEQRHLDLQVLVSQITLRQESANAPEAHKDPVAPEPRLAPAGANGAHEVWRNSPALAQGLASQAGAATDMQANERAHSDYESSSESAMSPSPPLEAPGEGSSGIATRLGIFCHEGLQRQCAVDLTALREGIAAMNRSLAELAPRNAIVALEGAVRDLTERVALLRQAGERETLLAPLDAMAAELRSSLKSHDPQAVVAGLEREISALAGKIDGLAESAISAESFDRIQRQTEEVRNLLAAAAQRSTPLERLECQIGELADRIERLSASPAPQAESAQMAASLADLRGEVERSVPISALMSIERRLEQIAARLDQEISQPDARKEEDSHALEDLARRIDDVRQSLEARLPPPIDSSGLEASLKELSAKLETPNSEPLAALVRDLSEKFYAGGRKDQETDSGAIQRMLGEIVDKLDRVPKPDMFADLRSIERLLQSLGEKLDAGAGRNLGRETVGQIVDEVVGRLEKDFTFGVDGRRLADQITHIHDRLESLAALHEMQDLTPKLSSRLSRSAAGPPNLDEEETAPLAVRTSPTWPSASVVPGIEALEATDLSLPGGSRRQLKPLAPGSENEPASSHLAEDDILLEPGAGAPQRVREAREPTREMGSKTNPSISAHIAAARRAANSAFSEAGSQNAPNVAPGVSRSVERARSLYGNHKRSVLLAAAFAIAAMAVVRLITAHAPIVQKSNLSGQPSKTAEAGGSSGKPPIAAPAIAPRIDSTPTASIAVPSEVAKANPQGAAIGPELSPRVAAALPTPLLDAVVSGSPAGEYELAQRLFEGQGVPQDQQAAVLWFQRAASSGLAPAQFRLGTLYNKGVGVQRDTAAAKRWYARAAEAGNARAAHNLAVMYTEPVGETPDYVEAAKWFRKAAELGVRDSAFNLAILYARGLGVDQDLRQSWLWFSVAAAEGDGDAARKRDEVAAKMDAGALAAAADDFAKFKVGKPDPAANEVASPRGGWDGKQDASPLSQTPASPGAVTSMSPP